MTAKELISENIPSLKPVDLVDSALQIMNETHVKHLAVVTEDNRYLGLISENILLDAGNDTLAVDQLTEHFTFPCIFENDHFLKAAQVIKEQQLSVIPVLNEEREFTGIISAADLLNRLTGFVGSDEPGGLIVIETEKRNFSFSELSRLVETNDALITQLNTDEQPEQGLLTITIKINKTEIADIVATLQRFEYNVVYYQGEEAYENELRSNYNNLMNYLNI
jgi:acetoin utilization protein AcuB